MRTPLHGGLLCHLQGDNDKLASIYANALVDLAQAKNALDTVHADVDSLQARLLPHAVWELDKEAVCLQALMTYACMCWQSPAKLRKLRDCPAQQSSSGHRHHHQSPSLAKTHQLKA